MDGVDGVLAQVSRSGRMQVICHDFAPFDAPLRAALFDLNTPGEQELHRAALAANALSRVYAQVTGRLCARAGLSAAQVRAIGAHGQTVRHQPQSHDGTGYTWQIQNPALLAELSGMDVVADFRNRDLAAGGQGAPLVPAFHQGVFGQPGQTVAVLNIGGISNLSLLGADGSVRGWDCGPGNALMDHWCERHTGAAFDAQGQWAASGHVRPALLARWLDTPYLHSPPPKSTGRDLFNPSWLTATLDDQAGVAPEDVQATLTEFTAQACARDVRAHAPAASELVVCGGGALNTHLMQRLAEALPGVRVVSSDARGLPALQVEAAAFAWLAFKAVHRETASLPSVTGARGARVLGAIYPR